VKQKLKAFRETQVELNFPNKFFRYAKHTNFTHPRKILEKQKLKAFRETCEQLNFTNKFFNMQNMHTNFTHPQNILVKQKFKAFRKTHV
jgi:hypothetical protein